jgi:phosphomethylpyrimidine synthase
MSVARAKLDWEYQLKNAYDPERAAKIRGQFGGAALKSCTMCGQYCVFLLLDKYTRGRREPSVEELLERYGEGLEL